MEAPDLRRAAGGGIGAILAALARAGFNAEEVDKITHGNWLRVYAEALAPSRDST